MSFWNKAIGHCYRDIYSESLFLKRVVFANRLDDLERNLADWNDLMNEANDPELQEEIQEEIEAIRKKIQTLLKESAETAVNALSREKIEIRLTSKNRFVHWSLPEKIILLNLRDERLTLAEEALQKAEEAQLDLTSLKKALLKFKQSVRHHNAEQAKAIFEKLKKVMSADRTSASIEYVDEVIETAIQAGMEEKQASELQKKMNALKKSLIRSENTKRKNLLYKEAKSMIRALEEYKIRDKKGQLAHRRPWKEKEEAKKAIIEALEAGVGEDKIEKLWDQFSAAVDKHWPDLQREF